jgi:hypothetical protein
MTEEDVGVATARVAAAKMAPIHAIVFNQTLFMTDLQSATIVLCG